MHGYQQGVPIFHLPHPHAHQQSSPGLHNAWLSIRPNLDCLCQGVSMQQVMQLRCSASREQLQLMTSCWIPGAWLCAGDSYSRCLLTQIVFVSANLTEMLSRACNSVAMSNKRCITLKQFRHALGSLMGVGVVYNMPKVAHASSLQPASSALCCPETHQA